ncbi:hypothetical protein [Microbacterium elymi]|uniref:hypothetical protein n=1 Tax=Microbacterium elymi TaxID=2909587 RepID=UPI003F49B26B
MARSPLTLAATVTAALPSASVVGVAPLTEHDAGRFDSAVADLADGRRVVVRIAADDDAAQELTAQARALAALTSGVRSLAAVPRARTARSDRRGLPPGGGHRPPGRLPGGCRACARRPWGRRLARSGDRGHPRPARVGGAHRRPARPLAGAGPRRGVAPAGPGHHQPPRHPRLAAVPMEPGPRRGPPVAIRIDPVARRRLGRRVPDRGPRRGADSDRSAPVARTARGRPRRGSALAVLGPGRSRRHLRRVSGRQRAHPGRVAADPRTAVCRTRVRVLALHGHDEGREDVIADAVALLASLADTVLDDDLLAEDGMDVDDAIALLGRMPDAAAPSVDTSLHTDAFDADDSSFFTDTDLRGSAAPEPAVDPDRTAPLDVSDWVGPAGDADAVGEADRASEAALRRWAASE